MHLVLVVVGSVLILLTILSRVRSARWWIRSADFPRLQVACALAVVLAAFITSREDMAAFDFVFIAGLAGSLGFQCFRIFPYTVLARQQVRSARVDDPSRSIRLLISNVLMENRRSDEIVDLVRMNDPDLVFLVETDNRWEERLRVLDRDYPYSLKQPQENYYGMLLLSKLELPKAEVRFLIEGDVPSIRAVIRLRSGDLIDFYGVHPRPPEPHSDTETRDAELLIVGRQVRTEGRPAIVAGDLNDVAWSHTTRLFQRISGTLDPRRGRGMYSTFHARYPILRWPLDHIFHEASFTLIRLKRLGYVGSDHFPVLIDLAYEPNSTTDHGMPEPDGSDRAEAMQKRRQERQVERRRSARYRAAGGLRFPGNHCGSPRVLKLLLGTQGRSAQSQAAAMDARGRPETTSRPDLPAPDPVLLRAPVQRLRLGLHR